MDKIKSLNAYVTLMDSFDFESSAFVFFIGKIKSHYKADVKCKIWTLWDVGQSFNFQLEFEIGIAYMILPLPAGSVLDDI